jgi:hypothetical protein
MIISTHYSLFTNMLINRDKYYWYNRGEKLLASLNAVICHMMKYIQNPSNVI